MKRTGEWNGAFHTPYILTYRDSGTGYLSFFGMGRGLSLTGLLTGSLPPLQPPTKHKNAKRSVQEIKRANMALIPVRLRRYKEWAVH